MSQRSLARTMVLLPRPARILFVGTFINRFGNFLGPFLVLYLTSKGYSPSPSPASRSAATGSATPHRPAWGRGSLVELARGAVEVSWNSAGRQRQTLPPRRGVAWKSRGTGVELAWKSRGTGVELVGKKLRSRSPVPVSCAGVAPAAAMGHWCGRAVEPARNEQGRRAEGVELSWNGRPAHNPAGVILGHTQGTGAPDGEA